MHKCQGLAVTGSFDTFTIFHEKHSSGKYNPNSQQIFSDIIQNYFTYCDSCVLSLRGLNQTVTLTLVMSLSLSTAGLVSSSEQWPIDGAELIDLCPCSSPGCTLLSG